MTDPSKDVLSEWEAEANRWLFRDHNQIAYSKVKRLIKLVRQKDQALKNLVREVDIMSSQSPPVMFFDGSPNLDFAREAIALTESLGK